MRVLVTGGAGYIGSHIVWALGEQAGEFDTVVFDNLSTGNRQHIHENAALIIGDLLNHQQVVDLFSRHQFDAVIHCAGNALVGESWFSPWRYLRDNVLAALNLFEMALRHGVKRIVFSSTANLYARGDGQIDPASPYGESKYIVERQLRWLVQIYEFSYCCLRYFNAAGAHPQGHIGEQRDQETHLIPHIMGAASGQFPGVTIHGDDYDTPDGTAIRDYIHVMDLAAAHIKALKADHEPVYELGSGTGHSVSEVIRKAVAMTGRDIPYAIGARRKGDPAYLVADNVPFASDYNWKPQYNLDDILRHAWTWHNRTQLREHGEQKIATA
jgi:UDP-glucose 4-epimerase